MRQRNFIFFGQGGPPCHGLTSGIPVSAKCLVLRVTKVPWCAATVPAIITSLKNFFVHAATCEAVCEARAEIRVSVLLFHDRPAQNVPDLLRDATAMVTRQVRKLGPHVIFQIIDY
jgi:hypothetical protein